MERRHWYILKASILVCLMHFHPVSTRCPKECTCAPKLGRKAIYCSKGGLPHVPVSEMDLKTHELVITAPLDNPNNITLGRIFLKFTNLETIRISHSGIPAIGDSSFWPGRRMKILDLSHNAISFLRESDFNGLKSLQELDLSDNQIFATPSAPFRHLLGLQKLSLARNRLENLVPRLFYLLSRLEYLDLSHNSIGQVEPESLQDVKGLKVLKLVQCRLTHLHPIIYQQLPLLEELDLRDNLISSLAPAEFRHLVSLTTLYLDGNLISSITEGTFYGHTLRVLTMSRNNLSSFSDCAFCNTSVKFLDFSHNKVEYLQKEAFEPLKESLQTLNISFNNIGNEAFATAMHSVKSLKVLHASGLLVNRLPENIFKDNTNLISVNLSQNTISGLSHAFLLPLQVLENLDLSNNLIPNINENVLQALNNITTFQILYLQGNPFSCSDCQIKPLVQWSNVSHFLDQNCTDDCLKCVSPLELSGHLIRLLNEENLLCLSATYDRQRIPYINQTGVIVGVTIIVFLVFAIVVIIFVYRRYIASHYYTHEEERQAWKGMYDNPALATNRYSDEKPTFIATPERVDEHIEGYPRSSNILR